MMRRNVMHKRREYFNLLAAHADRLVAGANATMRLITDLGTQPEQDARLIEEVNVNETSADAIKATLISMLFSSFATPISRDLLYTLVSDVDSVLDMLQGIANNVTTYSISGSTPAARAMASLATEACQHVKLAVLALAHRNGGTKALQECSAIDVAAARATAAMREAVTQLFTQEGDDQAALHAIKMRHFHFRQAKVLRRCRRVARTIEEILLENP